MLQLLDHQEPLFSLNKLGATEWLYNIHLCLGRGDATKASKAAQKNVEVATSCNCESQSSKPQIPPLLLWGFVTPIIVQLLSLMMSKLKSSCHVLCQ
jgi:hypothetical protein